MSTKKCEECDGIINMGKPDSRGYYYCEKCGLVHDPIHPMGHGINGLISYMKHNNMTDQIDNIRVLSKTKGLKAARLEVSKL